mgnify:CR=1 FL=1
METSVVTIKGQIVIPQRMREALGIGQQAPLQVTMVGEAVVIRPVRAVITSSDTNAAVMEVLKKTAGSWAGDDWLETEKKQRVIELAAAKKRKAVW